MATLKRRVLSQRRATKRGFLLHLAFPRPVTGPIAIGHSSHYGLGLFRPGDELDGVDTEGLAPGGMRALRVERRARRDAERELDQARAELAELRSERRRLRRVILGAHVVLEQGLDDDLAEAALAASSPETTTGSGS